MKECVFLIFGTGKNYKEAWNNALEQANQFSEPNKPIKMRREKKCGK